MFVRDGRLHRIRPDGSGLVSLTDDSFERVGGPSISPDGRTVVFHGWPVDEPENTISLGRRSLFSIDAVEVDTPSLVAESPESSLLDGLDFSYAYPTFSADGEQVAFISQWYQPDADGVVYGRVAVVESDGTVTEVGYQGEGSSVVGLPMQWSASGVLALTATGNGSPPWDFAVRMSPPDPAAVLVETLDPSNGNLPFLDTSCLAYSPDETRYVMVVRDGENDIFLSEVANPDDVVRVTSTPVREGCPSWSPDGSHLVFGDPSSGLSIVDVTTLEVETLTTDPNDRTPRWGMLEMP